MFIHVFVVVCIDHTVDDCAAVQIWHFGLGQGGKGVGVGELYRIDSCFIATYNHVAVVHEAYIVNFEVW